MHLGPYILVLANALALGAQAESSGRHSGVGICPWSQQRPLLSTCLGERESAPPPAAVKTSTTTSTTTVSTTTTSISTSSTGQPKKKVLKEDEWGWVGPHKCVSKWCLWSNSKFAAGRGIAAITLHDNLNQLKAIGLNLDEANPMDANIYPPPFKTEEVIGKGLGVIANKTIPRSTVLLTYTPVLLVHKEFVDTPTSQKKRQLLDLAIEVLPTETQAKFEKQMAGLGGGAHKITAVLMTNSFQMGLPTTDGHHYGNFPEVSRLNHNCRPNAAFHIDDNLVHRTTAVQKIKKGEEISISYLDSIASRDERRKRSLGAWGFSCTCPACNQHDLLVEISDTRLAEIVDLEKKLGDFESQGVTVKTIERLVKLYRMEKLESRIFGAYTLAALNYNMLGWDKMAIKYAHMAIETGTIESGSTAPDVIAMKVLAGDPKGHFTWRGRSGRR